MSLIRRPASVDFLVVGLGNPGDEYSQSRHNAGFMVANALIRKHGLKRPRRRYEGRWVEGEVSGRTVAVLMPQTYMNCSGDAVSLAAKRKHIPTENIIVVHDDMDFPFGVIRARQGGGTGGHNGLKSIVSRLGGEGFSRVRVGIGRPEDAEVDPRDWVLTPFDESEEELAPIFDQAVQCVEMILSEGIEAAMGLFNRRDSGVENEE